MSVVARVLLTLLLGYACLVGGRALLAFHQSTWGESYFVLDSDPAQGPFDQRGRPVPAERLAQRGLGWHDGALHRAGEPLASYSDGLVTVFRPAQTSYWQQNTGVRLAALALALIAMLLAWRRRIPDRVLQQLRTNLSWLRPLDVGVIGGLLLFSLLKVGIIDYEPMGSVVRGLHFGLNYYVHDLLVGASGRLTIFPYNPLSLLWMHGLAGIDSDLQSLGVHLRSYGLVSLSIFAAYIWLCLELTALLRGHWQGRQRTLFLLLLLNPFGLYYALFLGQIDVITMAMLVAGSRRLLGRGGTLAGLAWIVLGLVFAKPQHMLVLPALAIALFAARGQALKGRVLLVAAAITLASLVVYWLYARVPAFALSLGQNPQSARIGWATWFQLFGDAVVINRPLAFLMIVFLVLAYRVKEVTDSYGAWQVAVLSLATLTAWFQASYAHTFGMAMLMYPALMLLVAETPDRWRGAGIWLASILLLLGWGTGAVGDVGQVLGLQLFTAERVQALTVLGMNYPSLLATLEAAAYMAFGAMLLLRLLGGQQSSASGMERPDR